MRVSRVVLVARLEATEILRDPNAAWLVGALAFLACLLLVSAGGIDPRGAIELLLGAAPLGLAFLAGSRRGAAHEAAFRRLVLTNPIGPDEWLWGRFLGLHALGLVYLALVAPALVIEVAYAAEPAAALALGLLRYFAVSSLLFLVGLAAFARGNPRAPVVVGVVVLLFALTAGFPRLVQEAAGGLSEVVARLVVGALPAVAAALLTGARSGIAAPWFAAAPVLLAWVALAARLAARRYGAARAGPIDGALVAVAAAAALGLAFAFVPASGPGPAAPGASDEGADALFDLLPVVALLPFGLLASGVRRSRRLARGKA